GVAPCQCLSPGAHEITSPGRISSTGPPQLCTQPHPAVTINVCPRGWTCHAVRAPGSNVTLAPDTRRGSGASNSGSIRTVPVKLSGGPVREAWDPHRSISMSVPRRLEQNPSRSPLNAALPSPRLTLPTRLGSAGMTIRGDACTILQTRRATGKVFYDAEHEERHERPGGASDAGRSGGTRRADCAGDATRGDGRSAAGSALSPLFEADRTPSQLHQTLILRDRAGQQGAGGRRPSLPVRPRALHDQHRRASDDRSNRRGVAR